MSEPRSRFRYTLGMLMAFIAGMAVMLGILLPFVSWDDAKPAVLSFTHPGPMVAHGSAARQCVSCHAAPTKL
jgi:hypothetical protein